jgi:hypothetical protein
MAIMRSQSTSRWHGDGAKAITAEEPAGRFGSTVQLGVPDSLPAIGVPASSSNACCTPRTVNPGAVSVTERLTEPPTGPAAPPASIATAGPIGVGGGSGGSAHGPIAASTPSPTSA